MPAFARVEQILRDAVPEVAPAIQIEIRWRGDTVFARAMGDLDPETRQRPVHADTRFDLASVTKLFVTTAFMRQVETGSVTLATPVSAILPAFSGVRPIGPYEDPLQTGRFITIAEGGLVDAGATTFRQLLTHTSGLPAWRPLFRQSEAEAARALAFATHFAYPPGTRVIYSDIGLILLGLALERLTGLTLAAAVRRSVTDPLGLSHTGYRPALDVTCAPTEICAWRGRRVVGEVHDENAARLGGVSGHAGLFSTAADVAGFGQSFLDGSLLHRATIAEMAREQAVDGTLRRGLGFQLWSPDPEASGFPFGPMAFGHTGFTGTSLWIDPDQALVVALLTNRVYHGRAPGGIARLRVALHQAIVSACQEM
ncbi:MAG: serine hydrolase [Anaerolineales bacterium]|nr:serine hydrolase [Anaerolineales bacterium]